MLSNDNHLYGVLTVLVSSSLLYYLSVTRPALRFYDSDFILSRFLQIQPNVLPNVPFIFSIPEAPEFLAQTMNASSRNPIRTSDLAVFQMACSTIGVRGCKSCEELSVGFQY